jgi:hypothetical protein
MRKNRRAPLVDLPEGADLSTVTAGADQLRLYQPCLYGTTAWTIAEGKRQLAETANSFFHGANGAMTDIGRGYTRLLDSGRLELFVTFTIFGYYADPLVMPTWGTKPLWLLGFWVGEVGITRGPGGWR